MDTAIAVDTIRSAILCAIVVGSPLLLVGLVIGLVLSVLQAATQIQDQTVSTIPKILAMLLALIVFAPWIADQMVEFTRSNVEQIPLLFEK